jgi:RNA binding exosome subunit
LSKSEISRLELSFIVHATESKYKVMDAAMNLVPLNYLDDVNFQKNNLKGEYGNPISLYKAEFRQPELIEELLRNIGSNLNSLDKENLLREFGLRLSKNSLYIRLNKQSAYRQKIQLDNEDPLRLRIRFRTSKPEDIKMTCRKLGLLP